uniref:nucleolar RNA helicase 2-like isoform X1 n=1 Tax=Styela clava TaxID=7725 RepID=UPI00193A292C|nr:nucleolar RNA helicase 2-like isoform X1 [Styela clava]
MPGNIIKRKIKYTKENLEDALKAITEKKMSHREAAEHYGIPKSTLTDRISGKRSSDMMPKRGPPTALSSEEEESLKTFLKDQVKRGLGIGKRDVFQMVKNMLDLSGKHVRYFTNNLPSDSWWCGFLSRNPDLKMMATKKLEVVRAMACSEKKMENGTSVSLKTVKKEKKLKTKKSSEISQNFENEGKKKMKKAKETIKEGNSEPVKKRKKIAEISLTNDGVVQDYIETPPASDEDEKSQAEIEGDFAKFRISDDTIELLKEKKILYLFPIQIQTFDYVFDGFDVVAQARTGTGKTMSFALPLVEKLQRIGVRRNSGRPPKILVMAPTRELALQVFKDFDAITTKLKCLCIYGGTPYYPQEKAMRAGLDIVVGTPGRILDHVNKGNLHLEEIDHVILDEVDQMLDMGFAPSVEEILQYAYTDDREKPPQTLLFSATCPPWVKKTAGKYMRTKETKHVDLIGKDSMKTATTVQHLAIRCHYTQRAKCIGDVVQVYSGRFGRAIVFTETKRDANELALNDSVKVESQVLHGDIEQRQREITLKAFRDGSVKCLVATNVAARGLDIPEVDLVIQINPPKDIESYIHRSGRTGRAGRLGTCICFYKPNEEELLRRVERTAGIKFKRIGTPQPKDIIQSSYDDTLKCLDAVPEEICSKFLEQAEKVAQKYTGGALEALSAALAHMSGATDLSSRSLLNAQEGFTTWHLKSSIVARGSGFFWNALERCFGQDNKQKMLGMRLTQDKMGCVLDIPNNLTALIKESWRNTDKITMEQAESLPELIEQDSRRSGGGGGGFGRGRGGWSRDGGFQNRRSFGGQGRGGGFRGRGGGFRGRGGSSRGGGGMKRSWGGDRKYR